MLAVVTTSCGREFYKLIVHRAKYHLLLSVWNVRLRNFTGQPLSSSVLGEGEKVLIIIHFLCTIHNFCMSLSYPLLVTPPPPPGQHFSLA